MKYGLITEVIKTEVIHIMRDELTIRLTLDGLIGEDSRLYTSKCIVKVPVGKIDKDLTVQKSKNILAYSNL